MHTHAKIRTLLQKVLIGALIAGGLPACAWAAPELPVEMARAAEIYTSEVARIAVQHQETIKGLPRQYQADLTEMQKKLQISGDLDGVLATANEAKRFAAALNAEGDPFELVPEMPQNALVEAPAVLRALQDAYIKRHKESADLRTTRLNELTLRYINSLTVIQKDLTRKDRIADAVLVRNETERLRKAMADEQFVAQTLAALSPAVGAPPTADPLTPASNNDAGNTHPVFGSVPNWAKWEFEATGHYAQEGYLFAHPDLPDELNIDFNPKNGRGRVYGRCYVDRLVVDMRERAWFGKAIMWRIPDASQLTATIQLQAKEISVSQHYGPAAHLIVFSEKTPLQAMTVPLMAAETTLRVVKDPDANRCAIMWLQGKRTEMFNLPATGALRLLLAVTVRNPGERCDTTIVMQ